MNRLGGVSRNILISSIIDVNRSAPNRLHHIINNLKKHHNVTVICVNDWWKAANGSACYDGNLDGVDIQYITKKKLSPIAQELSSPSLLNVQDGRDFDIIFNYNTIVSGLHLSKKYKIPMIYDLADDLPEMISTSPQVPVPLRRISGVFGSKMMMASIKSSEKVTCISQQLADSYQISYKKRIIAPNGVDTELFKPLRTDLKEKLELDFKFTLGYVGVLREWLNFAPIFDLLRENKEIGMIIVGDEGSFEKTVNMAEAFGINKQVYFSGSVKYSEVPKYISIMDACTIPFIRNQVTNNSVPVKLFEYLACGKQVISSNLSGVKETVGDRILYADNSTEFSNCVSYLISDASPQDICEENRSLICKKFSWNCTSEQIERTLEGII